MDQIITAFICKIPSLLALIPLVLIFPEGYMNFFKHTHHLHSLEYLEKILPYKAVQTGLKTAEIRFFAAEQTSNCSVFKAELIFNPACLSLMPSIAGTTPSGFTRKFHRPAPTKTGIFYANVSPKEEKDEILEELKFSAQGIFTDSENTKTSQKNRSAESNTDSAKNEPENPRKEKNNQTNNPAKTEITTLADSSPSDQKDENPADKTKNSTPSPPSIVESKETLSHDEDPANQEMQEYSASPSRVKKEILEKKLNSMIRQNQKNETAHWKLFELYHHYMEWSQDTEFYQENQAFQTLKLLQDMYKQFGENQKIMKYLCQYFVINHLYVESKTYCQKAKKLLPDDTDLHLYADYFNESASSSSKSQVLLNLLKTKPPSEKLYTIIGKMFADKKKDKLSMKYFQKAVKLNGSYIPSLLGLSETLLRLGQYQPALKYYVLACQKHPYKSRTPFQKAKAYLNRNSLFKTASEYQKQINICINSIKISH